MEFKERTFKKVYEGEYCWYSWETFCVKIYEKLKENTYYVPPIKDQVQFDEDTGFYSWGKTVVSPLVVWRQNQVYFVQKDAYAEVISVRRIKNIGNQIYVYDPGYYLRDFSNSFAPLHYPGFSVELSATKGTISYLYDCFGDYNKNIFPIISSRSIKGYFWITEFDRGAIRYEYFLFDNGYVFFDSCSKNAYKDDSRAFKTNLKSQPIIKSPDNTLFYLTVSNDGTLSATKVDS